MLTPLIDAIKNGDLTIVENLLKSDASIANLKTEQGVSAVLLACYYGKNEIAQLLGKHKIALDIFEATALGNLEVVKTKIEESKDLINAFSSDGFSPLGLACFFGQFPIAAYLLANGASVDTPSNNDFKVAPIHSAAARKNLEIAKLLIENGANIDAQQMSGVRPLHSAAHNNDFPMVTLLVENGADVNAKTNEDKSPLQMAEEHNFETVIQYLKKNGAKQ